MVPVKPKFVSYYRVSTERQGRSGLGLEAQQAQAKAYIDSHGGVELASYVEIRSWKPRCFAADSRGQRSWWPSSTG
jgi:hypothetical protein